MTISEELQKKFNAQHSAYERIMSSEIAGATDPESKKEAVLWVTIEAICGTIGGVLEAALGFNPAAGEFTNKMLAQPAKDYAKSVSEPGLKVNPFFQMNGFDANDLAGAKYTQIYLESRRASAFVGSVLGNWKGQFECDPGRYRGDFAAWKCYWKHAHAYHTAARYRA